MHRGRPTLYPFAPSSPARLADAVRDALSLPHAGGVLAIGLLALGPATTASGIAVPFSNQQIVTTAANGAVSAYTGDVDGDGDLDALSASVNDDKIAWHENTAGDGSTWITRTISTSTSAAYAVYAADVDGDGDLDALSASASGNKIAWHENTAGDGSAWTTHTVTTGANVPLAVHAGDIDGDGDADVLSASYYDDKIAWYENRLNEPSGDFTSHVITTAADAANAVHSGDVDGDGDLDVLSASEYDSKIAWYENTAGDGSVWSTRTITTAADAASAVHAGDIDGDGDLDVLSASRLDDKIAWYENTAGDGSVWSTHTVTTGATRASAVHAGDIDGDGDLDVLSASRLDDKIAWYENTAGDGSSWTTHTVTTAADGAYSVAWWDVDGDGDADLLSASRFDNKIAWYENRSIHRSARFPFQEDISAAAKQANAVHAADLDGDGDLDGLSASIGDNKIAWYENRLRDREGDFTAHVITTLADAARAVFAADIDGDGHIDVLSASFDDDWIAWHENTAGDASAWSSHTLSTAANGPVSVHAADLDRDGDPDALSASALDNKIAWYENTAGDGSAWTPVTVTTVATGASAVHAGDIDGDGDTDVLSAAYISDTIAWHENRLNEPSGDFAGHAISTMVDGAIAVHGADIDGDGDLDVLSAAFAGGQLAWHENRLNDKAGDFTTHVISSRAEEPRGVYAADVDADGDLDVLLAHGGSGSEVAWFENRLADGLDWVKQGFAGAVRDARGIFAADLDGDGDPDGLSASYADDKIAWYENRGGQFALASADTAPSSLPQGGTDDLLKITMSHRGRSGDTDAELAGLELLFEEAPGDPLTSTEANALIENLRIYADEGSGVFEPGSDSLAATFTNMTLDAGKEMFLLPDGSADAQVLFGFPEIFFVVPELTADAARQTPLSFRLTHLTESSSTAEDRDHDIPLALEYAANLSSSTVTAAGDASCSGAAISLHNESLNGVTLTCIASASITAGPAVTVTGGADVFFRAPLISLNPGFSVAAGSMFRSGP